MAKWLTEIQKNCPCIPTVMCGNKADLRERKIKARSVINHKQRNIQVNYLGFNLSKFQNLVI